MGRSRHRAVLKALGDLLQRTLQLGARAQLLTLLRGPRSELAAAGPTGEVGVGLLVADRLGHTLDAYLSPKLGPEEGQRATRLAKERPPLTALQIGIKDKTLAVGPLEQPNA